MLSYEWKSSDSFEFSAHVKGNAFRNVANVLCPLYPTEEFSKITGMLGFERGEIVVCLNTLRVCPIHSLFPISVEQMQLFLSQECISVNRGSLRTFLELCHSHRC
jgi:hypothetical protein